MVPIPAGEFLMGSPDDEPGRWDDEGRQHRVRLAPFSLARTPITQAQWRQVAQWQPAPGDSPWERELDPDPSFFKGGLPVDNRRPEDDRRPVERVSWFDAQEFCRRLSQRTGRTYTLPSESQWEYACRAGTTTPYAFGTTLGQWQANVASSGTTEVGSFPANAWGLHDMHGNVWEWCLDHWHHGYEEAPADGSPWLSTKEQQDQSTTKAVNDGTDDLEGRLLRGGSWNFGPRYCRSACRINFGPDLAFFNVGFRVVCLPQGPARNP